MEKKFTVVGVKSLASYSIGSLVSFTKDTGNSWDNLAIKASINGNEVGFVANSPKTMAAGTDNKDLLYEELPNAFEGEVVDQSSYTNSNGVSVVSLIVKLNVLKSKSANSDIIIYKLKVKGSASKYGAKQKVIQAAPKGKLFLDVSLDSQENIVFQYNKEPAGIMDERFPKGTASESDVLLIKEVLKSGNKIEAKVTEVSGASYFVEIPIANDVLDSCQTTVAKKQISNVKDEIVANRIKTEELLVQIEDYLLANKINSQEIQSIFATYRNYPDVVSHRIVSYPKILFKDTEAEVLKIAIAAISNGFHILCSGDKGTGKNCLLETLAWIYQRPFYELSINRDTDKLEVLGGKTFESSVDDEGRVIEKIEYQPEILLEAMEYGGIIDIDEINFADPGVTALLHSITDDRRTIEVAGYKKIYADKNFVVAGTMNLDYEGTNELNEALRDRFIDIRFPSSPSIFDILEAACPKAAKSDIQKADQLYHKIHGEINSRSGMLDSNCLTVRGFIQALTMSPILGLRKAMVVGVADKVSDDSYHQNLINMINVIFGEE